MGQVVHDYGDVCQAVTELAFESDAHITVDEFHTLNSCLDDAIAQAVTEYSRLRDMAGQSAGTETFRVELRHHLDAAMMSFEVLKRGAVSIAGSTGAVLERSLKSLADLTDRWPK